jgi:hypothetical protein
VTIRAAVQWHHIETLLVGQAFGLDRASRLPGVLAEVLSDAAGRDRCGSSTPCRAEPSAAI